MCEMTLGLARFAARERPPDVTIAGRRRRARIRPRRAPRA
jgi:hypothetical protein